MMFQSYALWPHMTVARNVAFGLEERQVPSQEIDRRVKQALSSVRMERLRRPEDCSTFRWPATAGCPRSRASSIRPRALLLDEPLSNLDAKLRLEMRAEIRRVCKSPASPPFT